MHVPTRGPRVSPTDMVKLKYPDALLCRVSVSIFVLPCLEKCYSTDSIISGIIGIRAIPRPKPPKAVPVKVIID